MASSWFQRYLLPKGELTHRGRPVRPELITDIGLPGPDRGAGGRYLIVGPGYDGPLPDSGFHVFHARTTRVTALGRGFMVDNDPAAPVKVIREKQPKALSVTVAELTMAPSEAAGPALVTTMV